MKNLQAQLNPLAENNCERIAVVLEGRDTAGKSSTIRSVTEYLNPAWYSIVPSTKPSASAMANWLSYWAQKLPAKNQIVFYDRSWYSRALCQQLNGWCSARQYDNFLTNYKAWEFGAESGQKIRFIKFWLSISEDEQKRRIERRQTSPLTYWKFSENDLSSLSNYDKMSILKERVIDSSWHVIDYNDKQKGIENFLEILISELCST
jgi:polyphosphate kinase 2 (PPK2 family)